MITTTHSDRRPTDRWVHVGDPRGRKLSIKRGEVKQEMTPSREDVPTSARTVISDLPRERWEEPTSSSSRPAAKAPSLAFLRSMVTAGTTTPPGASDED